MRVLEGSYALFPKHQSPNTHEGVIDLEDNKSIDMEERIKKI
jgi:hypothetical protein